MKQTKLPILPPSPLQGGETKAKKAIWGRIGV